MLHCDNCGQFARGDDLEYQESKALDIHGNLIEHDWLEHKAETGCKSERARDRALARYYKEGGLNALL